MPRKQRKKNDPIGTLIATLIVLSLLLSAVTFVWETMCAVFASATSFVSAHWPLLLCCIAFLAALYILFRVRQKDRARKEEAERDRQYLASLTDLRRKAIKAVLDTPLSVVDTLSGEDFESYVLTLFIALGYSNVVRTQLSNDYGVDVIAELNGQRYGIQCKRYSHSVGREAVQQVVGGLNHYRCNQGIVVTNSAFTPNARVLAQENHVILIDRARLQALLAGIKPLPSQPVPAAQKPRIPKLFQKPSPAPAWPTYNRSAHWGVLSSGGEPLFLPAGRYQVGVDIPIGTYRLTGRGAPCSLRLTAYGQRTERSLEADSNWCLTAQHGALLEVAESGALIEKASGVHEA